MNLPAVIDVAIGLVVLYLLLSTVCSFGMELLATWFWWRKQLLYETIARLLTGRSGCKAPKAMLLPRWSGKGHQDEVIVRFWRHPLALSLAPDKQIPSYVSPSTFSAIVVDLAVPGAATGTMPASAEGIERVIELAASSGEKELRPLCRHLASIYRLHDLNRTTGESPDSPLVELRSGIEKWYVEAMERLSGQYKRIAQRWLLGLGFVIAAAFNADTIRTAYVLGTNEALRNTVATYGVTVAAGTNAPVAQPSAAATPAATNAPSSTTTHQTSVDQLRVELVGQLKELQHLQQLGFPMGWKGGSECYLNFVPYNHLAVGWQWLIKLAGLFATALAVSLGAPFWFDLLNKLVNLRSSGKPIVAAGSSARDAKSAAAGGARSPAAAADASASPAAAVPAGRTAGQFVEDLSDGRLGFNLRKAYWSAEAALLAYAGKESVRTAVQQWSMDVALTFEKTEAAQGFLAATKDRKIALLAFRGTEQKLDDWKTDAAFKLVASPTGAGRTHEGFTNELEKVYPEIVAALKNQVGNDTLLYVTGHSLGGALATLMAARLAKDKVCGIHAVHTFGSPRVGDPEFAKAYELALGQCTWRAVNAEDLVTRVPPRVVPATDWRYDHVGQVVYFDSDGRMQMNAGFWERFLNTVINAAQDFRNTARSALKDHSMEGYVRLFKQQLPR